MENSRSRYRSRTRSPPLQQEEKYRDRSLHRKRSHSSEGAYIHLSSSRPARSPIRRKDSRSPRQRNDVSPRRRQPSHSLERRESRSYSHRQDQNRPPRGGGGFKWKRRGQDDDLYERKEYRGLDRGYRGEQDRKRPQSPLHHGGKEPKGDILPTDRPRKEKKEKRATIRPTGEEMIIVNINDRLGTKASIPCLASDPISKALGFPPPPIAEIRLTIYPELFKAQVAAKIGREPYEIMLKRQGERPFKDHLTLEDYGVSNGVQLDL